MKITVDYTNDTSNFELSICKVEYVEDYILKILFSTNEEKLVDFKHFFNNSYHPSIKKYLDQNLFSNFKIVNGNLNWNDYDLVFPIIDLYQNSLMKY
jgi:hypothetical protein